MIIHDLDPVSVARMLRVDLADVNEEPESSIRTFAFNGCTSGVTAFQGRPPWEYHAGGDELLFILSGQSRLTVVENGVRNAYTLSAGRLAVVPRGHWHSNDAPGGVTMLWITPTEGNQHSWDEPGA